MKDKICSHRRKTVKINRSFFLMKESRSRTRELLFDTIRPKDKVLSLSVMIVRISIGEYLYRTNAKH